MALFLANMLRRNAISNQLAVIQEKSRALADRRMDLTNFSTALNDGMIDPEEFASLGVHSFPFLEKYISRLPFYTYKAVEKFQVSLSYINNPGMMEQMMKTRNEHPNLDSLGAMDYVLNMVGSSRFQIAQQAYESAMKDLAKEIEKVIAQEDKKLGMEQKKLDDQAKLLEKEEEALNQSIDKGIEKSAPKYC